MCFPSERAADTVSDIQYSDTSTPVSDTDTFSNFAVRISLFWSWKRTMLSDKTLDLHAMSSIVKPEPQGSALFRRSPRLIANSSGPDSSIPQI
jgi:hypothetical protein